jgi:hypothetical protein
VVAVVKDVISPALAAAAAAETAASSALVEVEARELAASVLETKASSL